MAPIDLKKNRESILKAHKEVSDPHGKTNWALFGYEGHSDVLKVLSTGDGGLEELQEDLSAGKILYAYVKIIDPNTNLPKFVFINWQGEGVPEQRKGGCASHVRDVQALLRGAHVSINARTEDDVEESVVIQKVSKASGANYSFHKEEKRPMPAIGPVGSVYEKVRPQIEIKPDIREKFWEESEREEKQRILVEKQRQAQEKAKLDKEAKEREVTETRAREEREAERLKKIRDIKSAEKQASETSVDKTHWDEADAKRDEEERAKRSDQMRKDRAAEAKSLVAGKTSGIRSAFEQKPTSQFDKAAPPARKLQQPSFLDSQSGNEPVQRKQPIQLPKGPSSPPAPASPPAHTTRAAAPPPAAAAAAAEEEMYEDVAAVQQHEDADELYDDASTLHKPAAAADSAPATRNLLAQGLPQRPPSDDEQEDYQNWEDDDDKKSAPQPAAVVAPEPEEELYQDTGIVTPAAGHKQTNDDEQLYEDTGNSGVTARALYDYQAAEENEITFDPDDIISNIEMIDEGWWIGTTANGHRGMFPSNYVELF